MPVKYTPLIWSAKDVGVLVGSDEIASSGIDFTAVEYYVSGVLPQGALFIPQRTARAPALAEKIQQAFAAGAAAALVDNASVSGHINGPVYLVKDNQEALLALGRAGRARFRGKCVAVTGSVGKTTVKEMTGLALSACSPTLVSRANFNLATGVLSTLASMPEEMEAAVVEVSSARPGDISLKTREVRPNIGVVTNVGLSHGDMFDGAIGLLKEKLCLLDYLEPDGVAIVGESVVNSDVSNIISSKPNVERLVVVGYSSDSHVRIKKVNVAVASTEAVIEVDGKDYFVFVPLAGSHFAEAAAFALATVSELGMDVKVAAAALRFIRPSKQRNVRWDIKLRDGRRIELLDDSYNAAPSSMRAFLAAIGKRDGGTRKVLVIGDMLDIGGDVQSHHRALTDNIVDSGAKLVLTVGPMSALVAERLPHDVSHVGFDDASGAAKEIQDILKDGDLVAMKGSNGMGLNKIARTLIRSGKGTQASAYWSIEGCNRERP